MLNFLLLTFHVTSSISIDLFQCLKVAKWKSLGSFFLMQGLSFYKAQEKLLSTGCKNFQHQFHFTSNILSCPDNVPQAN